MQYVKAVGLVQVREDVEVYLDAFYKDQVSKADSIHPDYKRLWEIMHLNHTSGGKRIRPYIMMLSYSAHGGTSYDAVLPIAAALEVLHTALLIHDDIIDRDYTRHGKPNVAGHYKKVYRENAPNLSEDRLTHLAHSAAILAGDLAISAAYQLAAASDIENNEKVNIIKMFGDIIFTVGGGELLDSETITLPFEATDVLTVAQFKTADYSFAAPLTIGAQLAHAPKAQQTAMRNFGIALGIAFQLQDDLLGIFGNEKDTGKSITSDIEEQKRTYLMREAFTNASETQRKRLNVIIDSPSIDVKQLGEIREILIACGAKSSTEKAIEFYSEQALASLDTCQLDTEHYKSFEKLVYMAVKRDR